MIRTLKVRRQRVPLMSKAGQAHTQEAIICCLGGRSSRLWREWTGHCSWTPWS